MQARSSYYSPNILIYLEIGEKKVRLADVLVETAIVHEPIDIPPRTLASLVFCIDGEEDRQDIVLDYGMSEQSKKITFSYSAPSN